MAGGRLFEQGGDVTPELTRRLAWGAAGVATSNSTWQTVITWLESILGFLKTSNNLSDLNDDTAARSNLGVYSTSEVDAELLLKADADNVLEKDNTTTYTPTSDYNPATKKYIDDLLSNTGWQDLLNISANITNWGASNKSIQTGNFVTISVTFSVQTEIAAANGIFELPSSFSVATNRVILAGGGASYFYIDSGERTIRPASTLGAGSVFTIAHTYPAV